tara:strand:- start:91 stop:624 length:534 start_codon:yes stop_codon:yes gene_type:complete
VPVIVLRVNWLDTAATIDGFNININLKQINMTITTICIIILFLAVGFLFILFKTDYDNIKFLKSDTNYLRRKTNDLALRIENSKSRCKEYADSEIKVLNKRIIDLELKDSKPDLYEEGDVLVHFNVEYKVKIIFIAWVINYDYGVWEAKVSKQVSKDKWECSTISKAQIENYKLKQV